MEFTLGAGVFFRALFILFYIFILLFMTKRNETALYYYYNSKIAARSRYFVRSKKINETMTAARI